MNIAIASRFIAFDDSVQPLKSALEKRLLAAGHNLHQLRLPIRTENLQEFSQSFLALRSLKIMNADCLVILDPLLAILQHPNKVGLVCVEESRLSNKNGNKDGAEVGGEHGDAAAAAIARRLAVCQSEFRLWFQVKCTESGDCDDVQLTGAIEAITEKVKVTK